MRRGRKCLLLLQMSCLRIVGFLQLTAELLIGAEDRRVHCPSCAQPPLLYELASLSSRLFERRASGRGSLGPVPSTHRQKPSSPLPLSQQALARPPRPRASHPGPSGPGAESQMGRALEERERDRCQSLLPGSTMERERSHMPRKVRPRVHR
jgi:hypothetical protein